MDIRRILNALSRLIKTGIDLPAGYRLERRGTTMMAIKIGKKVPEKLKGDGDHEFWDIRHVDFDGECIFCRVRIKYRYGIAGAMMPCYEEQRSRARDAEADAHDERPVII